MNATSAVRPTHEAGGRASLEVVQRRRERGGSTDPSDWAGFVAAGGWR